jgi:hypothetical protein
MVGVFGGDQAFTDNSGGAMTGIQVFAGQTLSLTSTGTWSNSFASTGTNAGGQGPTGLNTVLPAARAGEMIGRIGSPMTSGSGPWFRVGASTTIAAAQSGVLFLAMNDIVGAWAGLRPLLHQDGKKPSELSRKDEIMTGTTGLISIAGGKLTTFRRMAERAVDMACDRLREAGKIGRWGVSNVDVDDLRELHNPDCAANQVLYNPAQRGIEFDLLPWSHQRQLPTMAYCPLAQAGRLLKHPTLIEIAERHGTTPAQVSLAWVTRHDDVIAIPKAVEPEHVRLNAAAASLTLSSEDLRAIDRAFAVPTRKQHLAMV